MCRGVGAALIGESLDVGVAGVVVDSDMEVGDAKGEGEY